MNKCKEYIFTQDEVSLLRDAVSEEFFRLNEHLQQQMNPSERLKENVRILAALKEQFKSDLRNW